MSFTDYATNEIVSGQTRVLVPVMKRRVEYQKYIEKVDKRNNEKTVIYVGEPTHGWEISREVPTTQDKEEAMRSQYENSFEALPKIVMVKVSPKPFTAYRSQDED